MITGVHIINRKASEASNMWMLHVPLELGQHYK